MYKLSKLNNKFIRIVTSYMAKKCQLNYNTIIKQFFLNCTFKQNRKF